MDMWREIQRLAAQERMTILLTTHYMDEADTLASQLAIVDRGRVVAQGTPAQLKAELHSANPTLDEVYLRHAGRAFQQAHGEAGEEVAA